MSLIRYEKMYLSFVLVGMGFALIVKDFIPDTNGTCVGILLITSAIITGYLFKNEMYEVVELAENTINN